MAAKTTSKKMANNAKKATSSSKSATTARRTSSSSARSAARSAKATASSATSKRSTSAKSAPALLSGGNPQIAKGDGDAPVQAYIAAMPGWKRDVGRRLDAIIERTVPGVRKAVRWNSPFYGVDGQGWFLSYHCITRYVKVAFFRGTALNPMPPVESKNPGTRYFHIHEGDAIEEALLADWIRQASRLPGETCF